jgi:hypothetical protein
VREMLMSRRKSKLQKDRLGFVLGTLASFWDILDIERWRSDWF